MPKQKSIVALIMAAGTGQRFSEQVPKQYMNLGGKAVLRHTVEKFFSHPQIDQVFVVIHSDHAELYQRSVAGLALGDPIVGGETRQDSVRLGLLALQSINPGYVLIHDAARPFVCSGLISRTIAALTPLSGAMVALPLQDSLKMQNETQFLDQPRQNLLQAQTPQAFPFSLILEAHQESKDQVFTDDVALAELNKIPISYVQGKLKNFKITTQDDLKMAELMLAGGYEFRTGLGFDVHRFNEGDHVTLGNIRIPFHKGVEAHSDGDVVLHALTDAILGAIGENDIGYHFPPSNSKWQNADSALFVEQALQLLAKKSGQLINIDITLLAEAPKMSPHWASIKNRLSELLGIAPDRIALKATTTEKLGFVGRSEGIAAQAIATVKIPI